LSTERERQGRPDMVGDEIGAMRNRRHASRFHPRKLARMIGRDIRFDALGRRLKCKRCNRKGRAAVILSDQRWIGRD